VCVSGSAASVVEEEEVAIVVKAEDGCAGVLSRVRR
jgi:hypothetical protein